MPTIKVMIPKLELLDNIVKCSSKKYTINNYIKTYTQKLFFE